VDNLKIQTEYLDFPILGCAQEATHSLNAKACFSFLEKQAICYTAAYSYLN